jgi:hypothetical protein
MSEQGFVTQSRSGPQKRIYYSTGTLGYGEGERKYIPYGQPTQQTFSYRSGLEPTAVDLRSTVYTDAQARVGDTGHSFWTFKESFEPTGPLGNYYLVSPHNGAWYRGPIAMRPPLWLETNWRNGYEHHAASLSPNEQKDYGQRAVNSTAPTVPSFSLMRALGELVLARPKAPLSGWRDQDDFSQLMGNDYLNVAFGWNPTIQDFLSLLKSLVNQSQTTRQLMRDSGRVVRRKFKFPEISTVETEEYRTTYENFFYPAGGYDTVNPYFRGFDSPGYFGSYYPPTRSAEEIVLTRTITTKRNISFSGAYTYHIPKDDGLYDTLARMEAKANVLLGTRFTPSTTWELTPWSWLVDWNFKLGQAFKSAEALSEYGLVIKYGYLMCHTKVLDVTSAPRLELLNHGSSVWVQPNGYTFRSERKERFRADPYGFAVAPADYTNSQWAILAALTLSHGGGAAGQQG